LQKATIFEQATRMSRVVPIAVQINNTMLLARDVTVTAQNLPLGYFARSTFLDPTRGRYWLGPFLQS
jgi:hypothetical protein